jgi:cytochrome c biogenesis protein CcmG/thiol:disulfide interchange protein DsbE
MFRNSDSSSTFVRMVLLVLLASSFAIPHGRADTTFDLQQYQGKVLLLDFWASWCVPCRRSFPWMNDMQEKYGAQGLVIVGVNMDAEPELAQAFLDDFPANFQIIEDASGELAKEFDVIAMPSSYVIDRNGDIVERHLGFKVKRQDEYEALIRSVLTSNQEEIL